MKSELRNAVRSAVLFTAVSVAYGAAAAGDERRQLDAHEHGVTVLNIALDDGLLILEMDAPAMNIVGFEHPARTDEQTRAIADALATLESDGLFAISAAADCRLESAEAKHLSDAPHEAHQEHDDHSDPEDHEDHDDEAESAHAEFTARYRYRCAQPERLGDLRVTLFERFPLTTEIEASFIGPGVQTFAELTPSDPVLNLRR